MKQYLVPAGQLHWYDSVLNSFSHAPLFRQNTPPPHSVDANWQEAPRKVAPSAGSCRSSVADHTEISAAAQQKGSCQHGPMHLS